MHPVYTIEENGKVYMGLLQEEDESNITIIGCEVPKPNVSANILASASSNGLESIFDLFEPLTFKKSKSSIKIDNFEPVTDKSLHDLKVSALNEELEGITESGTITHTKEENYNLFKKYSK